MYNRLYNFLTVNKIITNHQYGFRENYASYMALLILLHAISNDIDEKNDDIGIFFDLSKAVDTINHTILLNNLYYAAGLRNV